MHGAGSAVDPKLHQDVVQMRLEQINVVPLAANLLQQVPTAASENKNNSNKNKKNKQTRTRTKRTRTTIEREIERKKAG